VRTILLAGLATVMVTGVVIALAAWMLPRPRRRPLWAIALSLAASALLLSAVLVIVRPRGEQDAVDEGLTNPISPTPDALAAGEAIYRERCQVCHGASGGGNGPGAAGLNPPVSDFRVHLLAGHTDARFFHWISEGIPGTAMPAFKTRLSIEERWQLITFMRHTFTPAEK
jgi:mono/diheme cytochrome c family protein